MIHAFSKRPHALQQKWQSAGMTLLEVMLALTLTAFVLVSISMAIDLHLRMLDSRRGDVERIQVARAVLKLIANDLRSSVQPSPIDFSSLAAMAMDSAASGDLGDLEDALGDAAGADSGGGGGELDSAMADALSGAVDSLGDVADSAGTDIAAAETPPPVPGLYGNQYELQVDVSRLPRVDEMQRMMANSSMGQMVDIPSDVKTVAYYYYDPNNSMSGGDFRDAAGNPQAGLVRRVLDRAVTLYASENASMTSVQNVGEIIAPEIAGIQFEYFDGYEWLYEWDSDASGGLPVAVRITIMMLPKAAQATADPTASAFEAPSQMAATEEALETYSLTVRLPTAMPAEESTTDESGMEAVGL